eukprot:scaffold3492_cov89-Skeletonema_marinoi.AAC.3
MVHKIENRRTKTEVSRKAIFSEGGRRDGPKHESSIATRVGKATRHAKAGHKSGLDKRVLKAQ